MSTPSTFERKEVVDKPGIVGARWWQESVSTSVPRRKALFILGGVLGATAALGACVAVAARSGEPDVKFEPRSALDMQKQYGWSFGATGEPLVFDGKSSQPFVRSALVNIARDLAPGDGRYAPFFVPTLFQVTTATPTTLIPGDPPFVPLAEALVPIFTPAMEMAFGQGAALAYLLDARASDLAIVVDLPGPLAVAFAAGAASAADPIFTFDNWPHPRGVVPAHLTLAAAAYYQPLFARTRATRTKARPMFVLDRQRLASYTDEASQFDNRHTARIPSARSLAGIGVKEVLYVAPNAVDKKEQDDLVDDFLAFKSAKIGLHVVPATAFGTTMPYFYGGSSSTSERFWDDWKRPATELTSNDVQPLDVVARKTPFSGGTPDGSRPRPTGFGMVPVAIAVGTGAIVGARLSRSGSWNRSSGSGGG